MSKDNPSNDQIVATVDVDGVTYVKGQEPKPKAKPAVKPAKKTAVKD